jgi:Na+-transporting NADH:ubiquinone oxidoreductase subunit NqrB
MNTLPKVRIDPRVYQAAVQASLLVYGMLFLGFDVSPTRVALLLGFSVATQFVCSKLFRLPQFDPKSAINTGLSLCLLFRCGELPFAAGIAAASIASKFVIRWNGKHIFNPSNFGIVVALLSGCGWVSPAQWGQFALFAFLVAAAGFLVVTRASRADISLAFLGTYAALVIGRAMWLGDPLTIPFHRLQNGSLILYGFFMISDPKTTPDSRIGRIIFAALVAWGAWYWQFRMFHINGLMYALAAVSLLTPLLDWLFPGPRFDWKKSQKKKHENKQATARDLVPQPAG